MNEPGRTSAEIATAVLVVALALVTAAFLSPKAATLGLALFAAAGAAARVFASTRRAFIVRRKAVDVTVLLLLAAALGYLGLATPLG